MNRSIELRLCAAAIALLGVASAQAQTLGKGQAGGKPLTRAELRTCMKQQDDLRSRRDDVERSAAALQGEKAELERVGDALKSDLDKLDRTSEEAVNAHNERARAHDERIDAWNRRNADAREQAQTWQADSDRWNQSCGSRPYREDDEKAIKRGQ